MNDNPGESAVFQAIKALKEKGLRAYRISPPQPVTENVFECELLGPKGALIRSVRFEAASIYDAEALSIQAQKWIEDQEPPTQ